MKTLFAVLGTIVGALLILFGLFAGLVKSWEYNYLVDSLGGITIVQLQQMKQDCEKKLPRDKQCVIVESAHVEEK